MFGLDKYQYSTDKTFMAYHFMSNGPNGAIQKIAKFNLIGEDLYNFGLGDLDAVTGDISDTVISDNKDVEVIMLRKTKKGNLIQVGTKPFITVDPSLPSFEGHPFFEKKANAAKKLFTRVGLPKGIRKKSH